MNATTATATNADVAAAAQALAKAEADVKAAHQALAEARRSIETAQEAMGAAANEYFAVACRYADQQGLTPEQASALYSENAATAREQATAS